jgi:hypothetical protein
VNLSSRKKLWIFFFACTLLPAYWFSSWRYETKFASITQTIEREQSLYTSTTKLLANCQKISAGDTASYEATDLVCKLGQATHEHTFNSISNLTAEKDNLKINFIINFLSVTAGLNLIGALLFQAHKYLKSEQP